jgi:hypothetical protein
MRLILVLSSIAGGAGFENCDFIGLPPFLVPKVTVGKA